MTAPVVPVLTVDTTPPAWLTHAFSLAIPLIGAAVAILHPNGTLTSAGAQAAVIAIALALGAGIHIAHLVTKNGLTRVGLEKTVGETEAWIHNNGDSIRSTWASVQPILSLLPQYHQLVMAVTDDLAAVKARVNALPADQTAAAKLALQGMLGGGWAPLFPTAIPTANSYNVSTAAAPPAT